MSRSSRLAVRSVARGIEPMIGDGDPRTPTAREALTTFHELEWLGFSQQHFDELAPVPMHIRSYVSSLDRGRTATHEMAITMRRMTKLRELRYGWSSWTRSSG